MPEPISSTLLTVITDAVFSYALAESGLADKARAWLGREPARLAFQTALLRALQRFAETHPRWAASLVDETFLTREDVTQELSRFLTRRDAPDPNALAQAWAEQLPHVGQRHREVVVLLLEDVELSQRKGHVVVRASKGLKERTVPLPKVARRVRTNVLASPSSKDGTIRRPQTV